MNKECLTKWQIEILSNKYREERALLENAITELNRYLRRVSYEMALKQATPTLLGLLQAEFELTYEDELKLYLEFEEVPAETIHFEFCIEKRRTFCVGRLPVRDGEVDTQFIQCV